MSERDKIAKAITEALRPLGYRIHAAGGIPVQAHPTLEIFKIYVEPVEKMK